MIKSTQKGFTLIELMIVIAIIGILASIAIPQFASFRTKAFDAAANADLKNGSTAIEAFYTEAFVYPTLANTVSVNGTIVWPATAGAATTWQNSDKVDLGSESNSASYILASKHISGAKVFHKNETSQIEATTGAIGTNLVTGDVVYAW